MLDLHANFLFGGFRVDLEQVLPFAERSGLLARHFLIVLCDRLEVPGKSFLSDLARQVSGWLLGKFTV